MLCSSKTLLRSVRASFYLTWTPKAYITTRDTILKLLSCNITSFPEFVIFLLLVIFFVFPADYKSERANVAFCFIRIIKRNWIDGGWDTGFASFVFIHCWFENICLQTFNWYILAVCTSIPTYLFDGGLSVCNWFGNWVLLRWTTAMNIWERWAPRANGAHSIYNIKYISSKLENQCSISISIRRFFGRYTFNWWHQIYGSCETSSTPDHLQLL